MSAIIYKIVINIRQFRWIREFFIYTISLIYKLNKSTISKNNTIKLTF